MLKVADLGEFGAPEELIEAWASDLSELTDIQEQAVRAGAFDPTGNLLIIAPTSSGKTFVGEMAAASAAFLGRRHGIFLVPYRALADEHFRLFRKRYGDLLSIAISTADWNEFDDDIVAGNFNLAVMTYEKLQGFLVTRPDLVERCGALVIDEVQTLAEPDRGANLELLITRVLRLAAPPKIVALSASLDQINGLDSWMQARLVISHERPVPLHELVCECSGVAIRRTADGSTVSERLVAPQADREGLLLAIGRSLVGRGKQIVVFRTTIKQVGETATRFRAEFPASGLPHEVAERLNGLDDSDSVADLRLDIASGVAFHHADLTHEEREIVEDAFRSGDVHTLVATTTLAMGVNLPCDAVIVAETDRWVPDRGGFRQQPIHVSVYKNAAGRAGRLGKKTEGFAYLLADDARAQRQLLQDYVLAPPEPVQSQLPRQPFTDVVFRLLCAQLANDDDGLLDFVTATFAYPSFYEGTGGGIAELRLGVAAAVKACLDSTLVQSDGGQLVSSQLGRTFAAAGLGLETSVRLACLLEAVLRDEAGEQDVLFTVASCREAGDRPWLRRIGRQEQDPRPSHAPDGIGCVANGTLRELLDKQDLTTNEAKALVRTRCLSDWMAGSPQRDISRHFEGMGAAASRVRDLGKSAAWLLETVTAGAVLRQASPEQIARLRHLGMRARYGLPHELGRLARLRAQGITREVLLRLFTTNPDLADPEALLDASDAMIAGALTPLQLERLRAAILDDYRDSVRRLARGHVARAEQASLSARLVQNLYEARGSGLEAAVADAMTWAGLAATRVLRQPHGEEDIQLAHSDGTIVVSVTASDDDLRPIRWNKAKEILGTGAGMNPTNFVCIGRPTFDPLAVRRAEEIARESGPRSILLIPLPVFADAIVRIAEKRMTVTALGDLLARASGLLELPQSGPHAASRGAAEPRALLGEQG
jgi:helicase